MFSTPDLDQAVRTAYERTPQSVDQILVDAAVRASFVFHVCQLVAEVSESDVLAHLIRLRKRGAVRGGLPRKQR